ncbi:MAG: hypothetical protein QM451_10555 [Bacillota bacterium]|nr:hypothetical protein [Bacillota bacterium]HHT89712.1 hypothetical protein [Bacillota bacterium]
MTETANKHYNTYHQYQIQHANLKVHDGHSVQSRIKNAEVFLTKHSDYQKAEEMFQGMTENAPADYRVWWGILRSQTKEFTDLQAYISSRDLDRYLENTYDQGLESYIQRHVLKRDFYHKAMAVAPADVVEELRNTWADYGRLVKADAPIYLKSKMKADSRA